MRLHIPIVALLLAGLCADGAIAQDRVIAADKTAKKSAKAAQQQARKLMKIAARQSFIVNPEGVIVKHYEDVDPDTHTQEVLEDLEFLMKENA